MYYIGKVSKPLLLTQKKLHQDNTLHGKLRRKYLAPVLNLYFVQIVPIITVECERFNGHIMWIIIIQDNESYLLLGQTFLHLLIIVILRKCKYYYYALAPNCSYSLILSFYYWAIKHCMHIFCKIN